MLQGCITALVTPMANDGMIDYDSFRGFIEWQISSGVSGVVVNGSTGEAAALSQEEKLSLIKFVVEVVQGRVSVIVGSGTASTAATLDFIRKVNEIKGVNYLMCLTPYYVKPTQEGLYLHFAEVAKISQLPVIIYNVPGRTGCNITDKTILRLAYDYPNITAIKDATGDIRRCHNLLAHKPDGFTLLSGDDPTALAYLLCGGGGVISVVSNIRPEKFAQMCNLALAGNMKNATRINQELLPLYDLLFCESNPIPVKWGLFYEGRINSGVLRLPLTELSQAHQLRLKECLVQV